MKKIVIISCLNYEYTVKRALPENSATKTSFRK